MTRTWFSKRRERRMERTVLERRARVRERNQRLLAFLLPVAAFYFGFALYGLWPFGNRHLLAHDLYHQYAPFLLELRRKLLSGESLFFSWSGGLGVNFYSFFTYYIASPLNLLIVLFPVKHITEAVLFLTLLKIGLSGLFFREFLSGAFRKNDVLASLFACFYALSTWVYAYAWNIMWLDTLVFFPLAALGLVELVRDRRVGRFIVALTLMLMTNYYTAFFGCVFLFFYYFVLRVQFVPGPKPAKERMSAFGRFAGCAIVSALLSAVILWPTARALAITSASGDAFPKGFTFHQALMDLLGRLTPLRPPKIMSGFPNIYAGMPVLLLVPAFFANPKRRAKVRLAYGALTAFLLFSFQSRTLSFLWHGAHYPNSLDFRYAFVFVLLALAMAYQAAGDPLRDQLPVVRWTAIVTLLLLMVEQRLIENDNWSHWRIVAVLGFAVMYGMIFATLDRPMEARHEKLPLMQGIRYHAERPAGRRPASRRMLIASRPVAHTSLPPFDRPRHRAKRRMQGATAALIIVFVAEILIHAVSSSAMFNEVAPLGDRAYYVDNPKSVEFYQYTDTLRRLHAGEPWRAEVLPSTTVNDSFLYGTNGFSLFASPFPESSIDYFSDLGYPTNGVNSFQYKESTIVMDSVLSIDYLMVDRARVFEDHTRRLVDEGAETRLYKNDDALPFGFFVPSDAADVSIDYLAGDALDEQNRLVAALGGEPYVLQKDAFRPWEHEGCYVERSYDDYTFHVIREQGDTEWAFLIYEVPEDGNYYIFWRDESVDIEYGNGFINDQQFFQLGGGKVGIGDVGFLRAGTELHYRVSMNSDRRVDGTFRACVGRLDEAAWERTRHRLAEGGLKLDRFTTTSFAGTIDAPENGYIFLPTTANPGWTFTVDGTRVRPTDIRGSFILVPVTAGTHTLTADFVPVGFYPGLIISLVTLAGIVAVAFYRHRRGRKGDVNA